MSKYNTLVTGDFHIKDLTQSSYDTWQYKMFISSFKNVIKIIEKHNIKKLILLGDTFDVPPKGKSLELFAKFMSMLKPYNLEIDMIDGNHCLLGGQGKRYYCEYMKEYFKLNYDIKVKEYEQIGDILYCNHKHINRLEKLSKKVKIVYSHFRSNIPPISDEIDTTALQKNAELVILGDIHHLNKKGNIVYTSSPTDTHFSSSNELEAHTPSVLLLNENTLNWEWESVLTTKYRKYKRTFASTESFLANVESMREDFNTNHNFYKVVIQDRKAKLNTLKKDLYTDFCITHYETIDLDIARENKKISVDIIKNLATTNVSHSLLEFILKNNSKKDLVPLITKLYHKYEVNRID